MQVYLVGGAVRDEQLDIPIKERDWCVVGATPDEMLRLGYKPVGKDFPVFLHPETNEEYALARTERKTAVGYHGFAFNTDPDVTIDATKGLPELRKEWIEARGDTEFYQGREVRPEDNGNVRLDIKADGLQRTPRRARSDPPPEWASA